MKTVSKFAYTAFAVFAFGFLAASPPAQAVVAPPDGGDANGNTAEGTEALSSNTTGRANTAVGVVALYKNTTGVRNIAIGRAALGSNTTGCSNTAIGAMSLLTTTEDHN